MINYFVTQFKGAFRKLVDLERKNDLIAPKASYVNIEQEQVGLNIKS